jgi:Domain of unknown function (DUF4329)
VESRRVVDGRREDGPGRPEQDPEAVHREAKGVRRDDLPQAGKYVAFKARTQDEPNTVDVGQHEENCGCPPGAIPVAYYHTHPLYSQAGMRASYDEFSGEDKDVAKEHEIDAYVGTLDGSFLKYDRKLDKVLRLRGRLKNS